MSTSADSLQEEASLDKFFNHVATEILALFVLALCLRLDVVITNDERGDNPGSTVITV